MVTPPTFWLEDPGIQPSGVDIGRKRDRRLVDDHSGQQEVGISHYVDQFAVWSLLALIRESNRRRQILCRALPQQPSAQRGIGLSNHLDRPGVATISCEHEVGGCNGPLGIAITEFCLSFSE